MTRLLLASASPARRATLASAGIDPLVVVSSVDEPAVLAAAAERFGTLEPADAVLVLAQAKVEDVARAIAAGTPEELADADDLVLLGCDSMLELDGEVLGRPADAGDAVRRWHAMRGRTGVLHTGHWVVDERATPDEGGVGTRGTLGATSSTVVHFADLSDEEVAAYVATGEPLAVAGSFTVDGLGGPFVERIEGDHHGVVGVSLPLLRELLGEIGVSIPSLWRTA
ncbi:Maf family protein [Cellulomonas fimi]|uniref:Nucleoside triphosphate pyrophosphatase n=1 Tax=Cellulomonas fimi (strain ATCC 484 / DSM 20113 / JCM 1341 / CCUG 24087 / LMG 16345 / NBRC 15513 / NCIMB 8980 / NCTC 7547 / NRS-133) TaxID=590998 RepID=F4H806_CELFA|nr:nucleoside triphosphate pyrophosphatase [Cellulomonas fimi]AEE46967.1 maf protein [Cellulomonas fimi ATCC 484]NNH08218.1 septum formation inhibitor Maf [Cellulomonas fimi]VEH34716.1 Maf-like protein yhdE [Cellulomonas fimi]